MPRVFISYRRAESQSITDRIHDRLALAFGENNVFQDVIDIKYGLDFRNVLQEQVSHCDILLIIIGLSWATIKEVDDNTGTESVQSRLFNPDDFVRIETETGISRKDILTIPVLVNGATLPSANTLPESLRQLAYLNAISIRNNPYFDEDIQRLIARLKEHERERKSKSAAPRQPLALLAGLIALALAIIVAVRLLNPPPDNSIAALPTQQTAEVTEAVAAAVSPAALAAKESIPTSPTEIAPTATSGDPLIMTQATANETPLPFDSTAIPTDDLILFPAETTAASTDNLESTATALVMGATITAMGDPVDVTRNEDWTPQGQTFDDMEMVLVPPGRFFMTEYGQQVFTEAFWMSKTEVTNAQYLRCVQANACTPPPTGEIYDVAYANYPVTSIDWEQATAYAAWRGGRLPTEVEWEYAARGPSQWNYPWGNQFNGDFVVYGPNSGGTPAKAGTKPDGESWVGALDMSGNLFEWTATSCLDSSGVSRRIIRGGDYGYYREDRLTTYYRYAVRPDDTPSKGIRIVWGTQAAALDDKPCPPLI